MQRSLAARRHLVLIVIGCSLIPVAGVLVGRRGAEAAPTARAPELPPIRLEGMHETAHGWVADLEGGAEAELTLDPLLERATMAALDQQDAPLAAAVVVSIADGRVLALAGRAHDAPAQPAPGLALSAWAPAASVFKLVTAAALVDAGVSPTERVCYHDGIHAVLSDNLTFHPRLDRDCNTLAFGVAKSQNAILARLAHERLDGARLDVTARALGFGAPLAMDVPVAASALALPSEELAFAQAAAGFWHTSLSPLHGAWLAATLARGGVSAPVHIVDRVSIDGRSFEPRRPEPVRVLRAEVAAAVGEMMVGTTEYGTAKHGFHDRRGRAYLPGIAVAGKTGSLAGWERVTVGGAPNASRERDGADQTSMAYSWFVGYAPADHPRVAIAVLIGNDHPWRPRAHATAARVLSAYFATPMPTESGALVASAE